MLSGVVLYIAFGILISAGTSICCMHPASHNGLGTCSGNSFMCNDGSCIEGSYRCDSDPDCLDGSDEADCLKMTEEPVVPPQCYNITSVICGDILISHKAIFPNTYAHNTQQAEELLNEFKSEASCHQHSMRLICALVYQGCDDDDGAPVHPCDAMCQDVLSACSRSFQAVTQNNNIFEISCLALPDTNCLSAPGYCSGFLCSNNHCIRSIYYCDEYNDCSDLSDESSCQNTDLPSYVCHPINVKSCGSYLPYAYAAFPNAYSQSFELADQVINRLLPCASCHGNMVSLMCNLLFPECDGYEYEPCIDHCIDVISSCQDAFITLQLELNFTKPITCEDLPATRCLAAGGMCAQEDFQCTDGKCIPFGLTCDSHEDCLDNTDESNCNNGCPGGFFRCANETICIPKSYVCDGVKDCKRWNDEHDCNFCGEFEFQCKDDGYCLPNFYVCDGIDHCFDGSDELWCGV
ncbi:atrial natriuretic peptide-converting enzyme-like isoform X2 [Anneissia japonica]|uniref:atrial natriuretic peptide-converting enzyme-like isoform X2 n=1 Tax=Anneissia japonica TaxID=1529436 RepID=UPI0014256C76|nr:atrial natriuretic peptide-converting enzyme-like isoform X2 [Anneissia japonica]